LFEYKQTFADDGDMIAEFMNDKGLQVRLRMICDGSMFLRMEYHSTLAYHKEGQLSMARWSARRSAGEWWVTVAAMFASLHNADTLSRFGLTPPCGFPVPVECEEPWFVEEIKLLAVYRKFLVELGAARCWSQSMYIFTFPHMFVVCMHENEQEKLSGAKCMKAVFSVVMAVETMRPRPKILDQVLADVGYNTNQFVRELWVTGIKNNWNPNAQEMKDAAWVLAAGPKETQHSLESCFNYLQDSSARHNKNKKLSDWTKYLYTVMSPYASAGGITQIEITLDDMLHTAAALPGFRCFCKVRSYCLAC
jgi:hypothetical protein